MNRALQLAAWTGMAIALSLPAAGQDLEAWNAERAAVFSAVCMGTAPGFANLGQVAGQAGFRSAPEGLLREPKIVVSLLQEGETCACRMTVGAPDQTALVMAMFQRLVADHPDAWTPTATSGRINDTVFQRDGESVRLLLIPFTSDGQPWIEGRVVAQGRCGA